MIAKHAAKEPVMWVAKNILFGRISHAMSGWVIGFDQLFSQPPARTHCTHPVLEDIFGHSGD